MMETSDPVPFEAAPASGVSLSLTDDGIAWIRLQPAGGGVINLAVLRSLDPVLDALDDLCRNDRLTALILCSATPGEDILGYDPTELSSLDGESVVAWSHEAQLILSRVEELAVPTVALLREGWIGGAAEIVMACRFRVALPEARLGFPQVSQGFVPAWGGTVRLPRIVGLLRASRLLLEGTDTRGSYALKAGLIDRLLGTTSPEREAAEFALRRARIWASRPGRQHGVAPPLPERVPMRTVAIARLKRQSAEMMDGGPSSELTLQLLVETASMQRERAFARESGVASKLIGNAATQGNFRFSSLLQDRSPAQPSGPPIRAVGVLGGGLPASDLAVQLAMTGVSVRLKGMTRPQTREDLHRARQRLLWEELQGRISSTAAEQAGARLEGVGGFGGFGTLDWVIFCRESNSEPDPVDAVVETEHHVLPTSILALHDPPFTVTSTQGRLRHPERAVGIVLHFPTDRFPLLEVVPAEKTDQSTVGAAFSLARRLSAIPVVVPDLGITPGNRLLAAYLAEAGRLLDEGATVDQVDFAAEEFGFSIGPFRRIDALGSGRTSLLLSRIAEGLEAEAPASRFMDLLNEQGPTFYVYRDGVPDEPNPRLPTALSPGGASVVKMIQDRLVLRVVNEAAKTLSSTPQLSVGDLDLVAVLAIGFPRARGGPLCYAREIGIETVATELQRLSRRLGSRFHPDPSLERLGTNSPEGGTPETGQRPVRQLTSAVAPFE